MGKGAPAAEERVTSGITGSRWRSQPDLAAGGGGAGAGVPTEAPDWKRGGGSPRNPEFLCGSFAKGWRSSLGTRSIAVWPGTGTFLTGAGARRGLLRLPVSVGQVPAPPCSLPAPGG